MERTFIMVKPDGVQRGLIGEIISRFERRGLKIVGLRMLQVSQELASQHYAVHQGKPFYAGLIQYITSAPVVAMVVEGTNAIQWCARPWAPPARTKRRRAPSAPTLPLRSDVTWSTPATVQRPLTSEIALVWRQHDCLVVGPNDPWIFEEYWALQKSN